MKMRIRFIVPLLVSGALVTNSFGASNPLPPDSLTKEAGVACLGLVQRYSAESRRYNHDDMKKFITEQADDCKTLLSYSIFSPDKASSTLEKIESSYGLRATPYASEEEIRFRDNFHKNIISGAQKAANDEKFRYEMISLGGFILASPSSRNF
ncbi:MAG: hypothetical protein E7H06_02245 [Enterobacter asburiae]|nr:hypothetical protein [Enterobacter asburiae]